MKPGCFSSWFRIVFSCIPFSSESIVGSRLYLLRIGNGMRLSIPPLHVGRSSQPVTSPAQRVSPAREAGPSGAGWWWPLPVATAKSVDGPERVRRDRRRSHARRGLTQAPHRWKRQQRGRGVGRCGRLTGRRQDEVNDPLPRPGWAAESRQEPASVPGTTSTQQGRLERVFTHRFGGRPKDFRDRPLQLIEALLEF
jgi:hypothetical protein